MNIGSQVKLKSQNLIMYVTSFHDDDSVNCLWLNLNQQKIQHGIIPIKLLNEYKEPIVCHKDFNITDIVQLRAESDKKINFIVSDVKEDKVSCVWISEFDGALHTETFPKNILTHKSNSLPTTKSNLSMGY